MEIEAIKFIMPRFAYSDGRPAGNIFIHLDILGDDEIRYQHFRTDEDGRIFSGGKPAMVREGKYDLCATRNDVHDDLMDQYKPYNISIHENEVITIPEDIVLDWAWGDVHEYIQSLEENRKELEQDLRDIKTEVGVLEEQRLKLYEDEGIVEQEKIKIQNIYSNIGIAKKKIEENWDLVEKGKTKLKVLLDKQEDTLEYLELAEKEKGELRIMRGELDEKKRQMDLIFQAIVGGDAPYDGDGLIPGEEVGQVTDDKYMEEFYGDPDIETLRRIKEHILSINEKRKQLERAKEKILAAREQLKDRKEGMQELSEEMKETVNQYDQLLGEIKEEKDKLAAVKRKMFEGWEKLKFEYGERLKEVETRYLSLEKEKTILRNKKDKIKDLFFEGKDRLKDETSEVLQGKQKLAELGEGLQKQSVKIKEAVIAKHKYEERYDALKEEERALEKRELELRRDGRKMERDHSLRMEAYAQNDSDIEAEFKALDDMRVLIKVQRTDFVKDRLQFLKESMYYECPVCGGTIPVKSSERPLRVQCPSCTTEFNLKVKQKYQCPECSDTIIVTTSKRPLNVKCQKCASEFIIRKPFKYEEDIIPDKIKAKIKTT
jgi:Zn finger protein HypA/HybF involved in hydrogenase expression